MLTSKLRERERARESESKRENRAQVDWFNIFGKHFTEYIMDVNE